MADLYVLEGGFTKLQSEIPEMPVYLLNYFILMSRWCILALNEPTQKRPQSLLSATIRLSDVWTDERKCLMQPNDVALFSTVHLCDTDRILTSALDSFALGLW